MDNTLQYAIRKLVEAYQSGVDMWEHEGSTTHDAASVFASIYSGLFLKVAVLGFSRDLEAFFHMGEQLHPDFETIAEKLALI